MNATWKQLPAKEFYHMLKHDDISYMRKEESYGFVYCKPSSCWFGQCYGEEFAISIGKQEDLNKRIVFIDPSVITYKKV